ncbi:MAG: PGF-CTERM sorting domain-containing protein [Methanocorpusculum parvum]|nr:PGF-CTERM sorting domain-containing protein [Methanocorpusculum parvum]
MNAKKIMGAVLVALLAAALFVGAAAAEPVDIGPVMTYSELPTVTAPGFPGTGWAGGMTFIAADGTPVSVVDDGTDKYFPYDGDALNKKYSGYGITFTLVAPNAVVAALNGAVNVIGTTVSEDVANNLVFSATLPDGTAANTNTDFVFINEAGVIFKTQQPFTPGKWGVAAVLTTHTGIDSLTTPVYGQFYYFTVSKTGAEITAVKDTVNVGQSIVLKIEYPGAAYAAVYFDDDYVSEIRNQAGVSYTNGNEYVVVTLDQYGAGSVAFKAADKGKAKFTLSESNDATGTTITDAPGNPKVTVTIEKGTITAVADEESFFTGNAIALSGTTTAGDALFFYIEGQNFPLVQLNGAGGYPVPGASTLPEIDLFADDGDLEVENGEWTAAFKSGELYTNGKKLVAGTYTVIVSTYDYSAEGPNGDMNMKESVMDAVYGTAAVTLTQPFLTDIKADAVAIQENDFKITGTAYSAENVRLYIFGYNYFKATGNIAVDEEDETFEYTLKGSVTKDMAPGIYFYLIQHPMGDKKFNVWNGSITEDDAAKFPKVAKDADFHYAATATPKVNNATFIFNAFERGTNYAAQALLEEIAGQNIDDTFVQGTFEVEAQKLVINDIPAEVAKGTALTISGYTNSGEGTEVIVNVLSGKFGATVKGDENAALFLTAKAVSKEDGTFEATIDTSKLELGNYVVTVEIGGIQYDTAAVAIVAASEPVTPPADDEPVTPPADDEPVVPETPGFGALAALAGLGAVAVLLLRRE